MASIIDRLVDIVKASWSERKDDLKDPAETIDEHLGKLVENLAEVREKTQAVIAEERRAAEAVEKNRLDVQRYEALAKAALREGSESDARMFLQRKMELVSQEKSLKEAYATIHETANKMRKLHDDLVGKINQINDRKRAAISRSDAARARVHVAETAGGGSAKNEADVLESLDTLEERAMRLEGQAQARDGVSGIPGPFAGQTADDSLRELENRFEELEAARAAEEAELARLRAELGM